MDRGGEKGGIVVAEEKDNLRNQFFLPVLEIVVG
jgi:hypothetical protein